MKDEQLREWMDAVQALVDYARELEMRESGSDEPIDAEPVMRAINLLVGAEDGDDVGTLGSCGCTDYHMADCPVMAPGSPEPEEWDDDRDDSDDDD